MHISTDHSTNVMNLFKWLIGKRKDRDSRKKHRVTYKKKTVKILCMGKERVGKTAVIQKLCNVEDFTEAHHPTLYDDHLKEIIVDEYKVTLQFMDMGGSQNFPSMQQVFIQQADIFILFYSVDDADSYAQMLEYRDKIATIKGKHSTDLPLMVVRNKVDLKQRRLRKEVERRKLLNKWCGKIYDVSAKTGVKINAIMDSLIEESKFIGNEMLGNSKISGRYIFDDNGGGKRGFSATEVYHKAPTLFGEKDNSDEKMEKRRRRSMQHPSRRMSRRNPISRSYSFGALRRRPESSHTPSSTPSQSQSSSATHLNKDIVAKQPWMKELEERQMADKTGSLRSNKSLSVASSTAMEQVRNSFEKTESRESVISQRSEATPTVTNNNNNKNSTESLHSTPTTTAATNAKSLPGDGSNNKTDRKRTTFKLSGKKASFDEVPAPSTPTPTTSTIRPRMRKKSLSHTDLSKLLMPETRERSVSMHSPLPRIRKISSFRSDKNKPKLEIVHTTLKRGDNESQESAVEILPPSVTPGRKVGRSISTASRTSKDSRDSFSSNFSASTSISSRVHKTSTTSTNRRLSTSIDCVSEGEYDSDVDNEVCPSPAPLRLTTRRRSLSQNDLTLSVNSFQEKFQRVGGVLSFDERTSSISKKKNSKKMNSLPTKLTETYAAQISQQPGVTSRRSRTLHHSFRRKKLSAQQAFADENIEEEEVALLTPIPDRKPLVRRKISNSADNVRDLTNSDVSANNIKTLERPVSFDENRNHIVSVKSKRETLVKIDTFDGTPVATSFAKM